MLIRLSQWLHQRSTGRVTLGAFIIFILFTAVVLPSQSTAVESSTQDVRLPDVSLFYTTRELYDVAESLGEQGRMSYIQARFTFDVVWPVVYTIFLTTALSWLLSKLFKISSEWQNLNVIPVFGALFDYFENFSTSIVMARYPQHTAVIDLLASLFTPMKWISIGISFMLLVYLAVRMIFQKIHARIASERQ